jgi:hypothetical protein
LFCYLGVPDTGNPEALDRPNANTVLRPLMIKHGGRSCKMACVNRVSSRPERLWCWATAKLSFSRGRPLLISIHAGSYQFDVAVGRVGSRLKKRFMTGQQRYEAVNVSRAIRISRVPKPSLAWLEHTPKRLEQRKFKSCGKPHCFSQSTGDEFDR